MLRQNLETVRGRTARYNITVLDDSAAAVDLTGATIYFTLRRTYSSGTDDSDSVLQHSNGTGVTVQNAVAGLFQIVLTAADTRNMSPTKYLYDITIFLAGGDVIVPAAGDFILRPDVTRRTS